jgi:uncharacterized protein YciI
MSFHVLFRPGPAWRAGAPLEKQPCTVEHAVHLQQFYQEQQVFMGGPCEDKSDLLSVVVLAAASETEAFGSLQDNPDVPQGVVKIEVHPWQVVCGPPSAER